MKLYDIPAAKDCDKLTFGYCHIYEEYLGNIKDRVKNFLEIGVFLGSSIRLWTKYFQDAQIHGFDINPRVSFDSKRIHIDKVDQSSESQLTDYVSDKPPFQVIIDDGSHMSPHIMMSFNTLFDSLDSGGYYFIEDVANLKISLEQGKTWGSKETDFSDAVISIFENWEDTGHIKQSIKDKISFVSIYYANNAPLTAQCTSDFIVIGKK